MDVKVRMLEKIKQRRKKRPYRSQLFLRKNEAFSDQRISKHPSHIITTSHQSQPCMPTSQPFTVNVGRKFRNSQKPHRKSSLKDNGPVPTIKTTGRRWYRLKTGWQQQQPATLSSWFRPSIRNLVSSADGHQPRRNHSRT